MTARSRAGVVMSVLCLVGCATPAEPSPTTTSAIVVDLDCRESPTLERDLSVSAQYQGREQLYLTEEGKTCRF